MVYGVLRFINFAHGDVFMLGAFAGYYFAPLVNRFLPAQSYLAGALVLLLAMAVCAVIGMMIEFLAYRPLRNRPKLTVLITAIGVSLLIEARGRIWGGATKISRPDSGHNLACRRARHRLQSGDRARDHFGFADRAAVHRAKNEGGHRHARRVV
jgi:branched-subunit amino acid ABC-type transport system permease component